MNIKDGLNLADKLREMWKKEDKFVAAREGLGMFVLQDINDYISLLKRRMLPGKAGIEIKEVKRFSYESGRYSMHVFVKMPDEEELLERGYFRNELIEEIQDYLKTYEQREWIHKIEVNF